MMKLGLAALGLAAVCALATTSSHADAQVVLKPSPEIMKALNTKVQGSINVSVPAQLAGLKCSDITVYAESVEMLPPPPGGFSTQHKWTRSAKASGASLGACSYSIAVPGNSAFNLKLGSPSTDKCQLVSGQPTPNAYVSVSVAPGTTRTFDFASNMLCQNVH